MVLIRKQWQIVWQPRLASPEAEEGWHAWFVNEGSEIDGWRVEEMSSRTLCFESALLSYPYITTGVDWLGPDGSEIGSYRLITRLNGKADDDYLEIDCTRSQYQERQNH